MAHSFSTQDFIQLRRLGVTKAASLFTRRRWAAAGAKATESEEREARSRQEGKRSFRSGPDVRYLGVESYRDVEILNWSQEIRFRPELIFFPKTRQEVVTIVKAAYASHKRISIMGKGHSWNPLMEGSDYLVCTVDLDRILGVDVENGLVTVEPGATIAQVDRTLAAFGLCMPANIVGTTEITFGGLLATGSHGSGRDSVPMSDLMVAVEMVLPNGEVRTFSDSTSGKEIMDALRLNIGMFGVMSRITVKAEPTYDVEVVDQRIPLQSLFQRLPDLLARCQTVEVLWFPFTDDVTVKTWSKTHKQRSETSALEHGWAWAQRNLAYTVFDAYLARQMLENPASTPRLMRLFSPLVFPERTYVTDVTSAIHYVNEAANFPIKETEIAVPIHDLRQLASVEAAWAAMIDTVHADAKRGIYALNIIAHLRFSAGSTAYMSPAYGNPWTAWLDFGSYYKTPGWDALVQRVWSRWREIPGVRLHWAKEMQRHAGLDLRAMYGNESIDRFLDVRAQLDPRGAFANDFTRRLFHLAFPAHPLGAPASDGLHASP